MESLASHKAYLSSAYRMRLTLSEIEEPGTKASAQRSDTVRTVEMQPMFDFIHAVDSVFLQYEKAVVDKEWNKLLYNGNRLT